MTTIMIDNVSNSAVERFKQIAAEEGVTISVFERREENHQRAKQSKTIHEVLLSIPKIDGHDVDALFERGAQEYAHREIDWG